MALCANQELELALMLDFKKRDTLMRILDTSIYDYEVESSAYAIGGGY